MKYRIGAEKEPLAVFLLSLFASVELLISAVFTLFIEPDPKNSFIFGYSPLRLLLVAGIISLAVIVLVAGISAYKRKVGLDTIWLVNRSGVLRNFVYVLTFVMMIAGWLSVFCQPYLLGRSIFIYARVRPFLIALGISVAQSWVFYLYVRGRLEFWAPLKSAVRKHYKPIALFAIVMLVLGVVIAITKFGLLTILTYSNVPGVPLTGLQFFAVLLVVALWIAFAGSRDRVTGFVKKYYLIPVFIFLAAALVWGLTPMQSHYFSLWPAPPDHQPFPASDARVYDIGGISVLQGYGMQSYGNIDKPLYRIFLAALHAIAGSNYILITWLQIIVLAFIPVVLYFLGKNFFSTSLGIFLSLAMIFQQRNAIVLSMRVSTINPKLLMTEEMTLLGIILFTYFVFLWMRDRKPWQALLSGGAIGAASLVRFNVIPLLFAMAVLVVIAFWGMKKKLLVWHLSAYVLAFLIFMIPWFIVSIDYTGTPWLLVKFQQIFSVRYENIAPTYEGYPTPVPPQPEPSPTAVAAVPGQSGQQSGTEGLPLGNNPSDSNSLNSPVVQPPNASDLNSLNSPVVQPTSADDSHSIVYRLMYHFVHNLTTTFMSLPDSIQYDDAIHMSQRIYWIDGGKWQGGLPAVQTILIFLNILLVAVGMGYAWTIHRWAGLVPAVGFFAYISSLSIAMNSGGRYIVPINWIVFFYYGLAVVAIFRFVKKVLKPTNQIKPVPSAMPARPGISDRRKFGFVLTGVIVLACIIPFANYVLPLITSSERNYINPEILQGIPAEEKAASELAGGEILYPYYDNDILQFTLFTPYGFDEYEIANPPDGKYGLTGGEDAVAVLQGPDEDNLTIKAIYVLDNNFPVLVAGAVNVLPTR